PLSWASPPRHAFHASTRLTRSVPTVRLSRMSTTLAPLSITTAVRDPSGFMAAAPRQRSTAHHREGGHRREWARRRPATTAPPCTPPPAVPLRGDHGRPTANTHDHKTARPDSGRASRRTIRTRRRPGRGEGKRFRAGGEG